MAAASDKKVRVRHACMPTTLIDVNQAFTQDQQALLNTTPFHWVSKLTEEPKISSVLLRELVSRWDDGSRGFKIRGTVVPFTPADVCMILGLPATGDPVVGNADDECYTLSIFEWAEVTTEVILDKLLLLGENIGDFVRAYILLSFGELYFPRTGKLIYTNYAGLLDDLGAIHSYNWARAVYEYLVDSLSRVALAVNDKTNECQTHICGCAAVIQIWAMNHLSIGQPPSTNPQHPFPRFLNWPIVLLKKKRMKEACDNARVTVALTATDDELKEGIVRDALQMGQHHGYVHIDEHQRVLAKLRDHEEMIKALQADVTMLKAADYRRRSQTTPVHEYGGCSGFGGHDGSPSHETLMANLYHDIGDIGGQEMPCSPQMVAIAADVDPPLVMEAGPNDAQVKIIRWVHQILLPTSRPESRVTRERASRAQKLGPHISQGVMSKKIRRM